MKKFLTPLGTHLGFSPTLEYDAISLVVAIKLKINSDA